MSSNDHLLVGNSLLRRNYETLKGVKLRDSSHAMLVFQKLADAKVGGTADALDSQVDSLSDSRGAVRPPKARCLLVRPGRCLHQEPRVRIVPEERIRRGEGPEAIGSLKRSCFLSEAIVFSESSVRV